MGYPPEQFVETVNPILLCRVCNNVPDHVRQCRDCESVFCRSCIQSCLEKNATCPHCFLHLTEATIAKPRIVRNFLDKLRIRCQFSREGCDQTVRLEDYEDHVSRCALNPSNPIECAECGGQIPRNQISLHNCFRVVQHRVTCCENLQKEQTEKYADIQRQFSTVQNSIAQLVQDMQDIKQDISRLKRSAVNLQPLVPTSYKDAEMKMSSLINRVKQNHVMSERVEQALLYVDRGHFIPDQSAAYTDTMVKTLSGRHLFGVSGSVRMLNLFQPVLVDGSKVLVMAAYPGCLVAVLSLLVGTTGYVVAQDGTDELIEAMKANLEKDKPELLRTERIIVIKRGGKNNPCIELGPYHAILNTYKQDGSFNRMRYLPLLATHGIMIHDKVGSDEWAAFRKSPDGFARDLEWE